MHPYFHEQLAQQRREQLQREAAAMRLLRNKAPLKGAVAASPLEHPAFRRLWLGLTISRMGDALTIVALTWFVLQLTGSGLAIGLLVLCFQLPAMISSPLLGKLLDRFQPRFIMGFDNFWRAAIIAAIPLLYWSGNLHLWMVYGLALCAGLLAPATEVGVRVVIPRLVAWKELERANALSSISWDAATLVGPALAGFLILYINAPAVLLLDAATFVFMGMMASSLPRLAQARTGELGSKGKRSLLGFGAIINTRSILWLTILTLLFLFAQGLAEIAIPLYSQRTLGAGVVGYGLLMSAFGLGSLLALALLSQRWVGRERQGVTLAMILFFSGLLLLPLLLIRSLPVAIVVMALAGCAAAPYYVVEQTLTQRLVPEQIRGQVFGARGALNVAGYPLGGVVGGLLLGALAAPLVIGVPALLCIAMAGACLASPTMRGLRRDMSLAERR
ncbi:MAG: MFS transporter [Ktedonobacteraceae bacterium]